MKIFYITREFCTQGGTERIVSDKMNWLTEHGHEVCIVTINQNSRVFPFMLSERIKHYENRSTALYRKKIVRDA